MGTEYSFYQVPLCLVALAMLKLSGISDSLRVAIIFALGLALPAAIGFALRGGPVFRFMGIEVRRSRGRPASRLRCAWRNLVAWTPIMIAFSFNVAVLPMIVKGMQLQPAAASDSGGAGEGEPAAFLMMLGAGSGFMLLVHAAGAIYAAVRPQRGIQDLLAGTMLIPK